jgi:hypothetical protein
VLDSAGLCWVVLGSVGLCWVVLGSAAGTKSSRSLGYSLRYSERAGKLLKIGGGRHIFLPTPEDVAGFIHLSKLELEMRQK